MKKIITTAFIALLTVSVFAQDGERKHKRPNFSPEQIADLKTKKMTLNLDLSEKQQREIYKINKQNAIARKQKMEDRKATKERRKELSSDEIYQLKSARLEKAIAHKAQMKNILNDDQFEKWEKSKKRRAHQMKRKMGKRKMIKKRKGKRSERKHEDKE